MSCHIAVPELAGGRARILVNFSLQTVHGRSRANHTLPPKVQIFSGFVHALSAGEPIIGGESPFGFRRSIFSRRPVMALETIGPSPMTISLPTTTKSSHTSACSAQKKTYRARDRHRERD